MATLLNHSNQPMNIKQEVMGGVVNFLAIAYIIAVNPIIINANGAGFPIPPSITSTVLTIIIMTTLAAFLVKLPFVIAPGMGINALISYTLIMHDKLPINIALGIILYSSIILFILSVTPLRRIIINAIPETIQIALSVGIGLFLILIGFKNANIIIPNPNTMVSMGKMNIQIILCFLGFVIASVLFIKKKSYSLVLPIILVTILSMILGINHLPTHILELPDFSLFNQIDYVNSLQFALLPAILSLFIVNFFDATSTAVGLLTQIDFDSKQEKNHYLRRALITDGLGGAVSSVVGTSTGVIFVESSTGIQNGARTGLASLITALCAISFLFLSPLISTIPSYATAPILIFVGILMMHNLKKIKFKHLEDFISVILTVIMMPFAFSITAGAVFGIISYTVLKLALGKFDELNISLIIIAIVCSGWFFIA